jgi:hypothetical protein
MSFDFGINPDHVIEWARSKALADSDSCALGNAYGGYSLQGYRGIDENDEKQIVFGYFDQVWQGLAQYADGEKILLMIQKSDSTRVLEILQGPGRPIESPSGRARESVTVRIDPGLRTAAQDAGLKLGHLLETAIQRELSE